MKAITTRYLGPTHRRGSRIKASDSDGNSVMIPYDSAKGSDGNHAEAALALMDKMDWIGVVHGGHTNGGMVWVFEGDTVITRKRPYGKG